MENELVNKLCSKQGFEQAASELINKPDVEAFSALVEKSEVLFDFVKQNVIKRLQNCINKSNFKNLIRFLKIYSYDYEELIVSNLLKFADEETLNVMFEKLKNGTEEEKAYCVSFLGVTPDTADLIRQYADSSFEPLAYNCAKELGKAKDEISFNSVLEKLKTDDEFEKLNAVKFLSAYNDKKALPFIFEAMKTSSMAENIAAEIIYMEDIFELLKQYPKDTLILINNIINGLGEIIPLSVVFDLRLYELTEHLSSEVTLLNIKLKIEQLTENDEYLFDEDKSVKEEILAIKDLINSKPDEYWDNLCENISLDEEFLFTSLNLIGELNLDYSEEIKELISKTKNTTVLLKSIEVMKTIGKISELSKEDILSKISDSNIRAITESYFKS